MLCRGRVRSSRVLVRAVSIPSGPELDERSRSGGAPDQLGLRLAAARRRKLAAVRGAEGDSFRRDRLGAHPPPCHFIAPNLSRHSSANHPLLGELPASFVASAASPRVPQLLP